MNIEDVTLWAYLDTGSGRNFISQDATAKLKLPPYIARLDIALLSVSQEDNIVKKAILTSKLPYWMEMRKERSQSLEQECPISLPSSDLI